jgi:hypothetical protein
MPRLDRLLKHKIKLRKLWQKVPQCKTAVKWVSKTIRRMGWKRALGRWERKTGNYDATPKQYGLLRNPSQKRSRPLAPSVIHGPWPPTFIS